MLAVSSYGGGGSETVDRDDVDDDAEEAVPTDVLGAGRGGAVGNRSAFLAE